jgi:hypothetical protein
MPQLSGGPPPNLQRPKQRDGSRNVPTARYAADVAARAGDSRTVGIMRKTGVREPFSPMPQPLRSKRAKKARARSR